MIQFPNIKQFNPSNLKQFNCSIEKKNIIHGKGTKHDMYKNLYIYNLNSF